MNQNDTEYLKQLAKPNKIIVKASPLNGYGVFATANINKGDIVEEAVFSMLQYRATHLVAPQIRQVCYTLPCSCEKCKHAGRNFVLSSGNINLYNSSKEDQNIKFEWVHKNRLIKVIATKNIKSGTELLHYYGENYTNFNPVK